MKKTTYIWAMGLALPLLLGSCNSKNAAGNGGEEDSAAVAVVNDTETDEEFSAEQQLLEKSWKHLGEWASKPLTVKAKGEKVNIHDFAQAFCQEYSSFEPCAKLLSYLKDPENFDGGEKNFYVHDVQKHGYIQCNWEWEFSNAVTLCYWNRKNGHQLVGVTAERGFENDDDSKYQYMFYDYDKATGMMTPDKEVVKVFDDFAAQYSSMYAYLPQEGKDCYVCTWSNDDDDSFKDYHAVWNGMSFTFSPAEE